MTILVRMGVIRRLHELAWQDHQGVRGGLGPAKGAPYLAEGDMAQVTGAGLTVVAPGSSIGSHVHPDTEELWLILEGRGTGSLDGETFPVKAGDLFVVKAGHAHGLVNDSDAPLTFFGLVTKS